MSERSLLLPPLSIHPTIIIYDCAQIQGFICTVIIPVGVPFQPPTIRLWHVQQESKQIHQWSFERSHIKGVSLYKRDARAIFLYVQQNCDDFHIFFPSELKRTGCA
mgnify:CR=1 FL=1